jgi:hypothetical protein
MSNDRLFDCALVKYRALGYLGHADKFSDDMWRAIHAVNQATIALRERLSSAQQSALVIKVMHADDAITDDAKTETARVN